MRTTFLFTALIAAGAMGPAAARAQMAPIDPAPPVPAETALLDAAANGDGAIRILEAEDLAMLPQRIAADACAWLAGLPGAEDDLRKSVAKFDRVIDALTHGDASLGIDGPEDDRRVLADLDAAHAVWDPLHAILDRLLVEGPNDADVLHVADDSLKLLKIGKRLAEHEVAAHADPAELTMRDALAIEIAGRQELLAEEIAKDICLMMLHLGDSAEERAEMREALEMFEISLGALHDGMPEAGLAPPPDERIVKELEKVRHEWDESRAILTRVADGSAPTLEETGAVFSNMMRVTDHMGRIVHLYADASGTH